MKNVLHVISSPRASLSHSRGLSAAIVKKLIDKNVVKTVIERDLTKAFPPFLDEALIKEFYKYPETFKTGGNDLLNYSDSIFKEIQEADIIVIGTPTHNLGISAPLKAWIDQLIRVGITYGYNSDGTKIGFLKHKKIYLAIASGGKLPDCSSNNEYIESYLKAVFNTYAGITDICTFKVEGTANPGFKENYAEIIETL